MIEILTQIAAIIVSFVAGVASAHIAEQRGRNPWLWFAIGLAIGVFSLIAIYYLPDLSDQENERTRESSEPNEPNKLKLSVPPLLPKDEETLALFETYEKTLWYYLTHSRAEEGPLPFTSICDLWWEGVIQEGTYLWHEGLSEWKKAREFDGLREVIQSRPPESHLST